MSDHEYEVGGKVSVTLHDGTKIIDSPITGRGGKAICMGLVYLVTPDGNPMSGIASVDSYTPPAPTWARPGVRMGQAAAPSRVDRYILTAGLLSRAIDLWRATSGVSSSDRVDQFYDLSRDDYLELVEMYESVFYQIMDLDAATPMAKAKLMAANAILAGDKIIGW